MAPRVFIANYAGHDYTKAEAYGELKFVTKGFISFQSLDRVKFQVAEGLVGTRSEDWLVLSGTNIVNALAAVLWYVMHGKVKILNYDKSTGSYREIILTGEATDKLLKVLNDV